MTATWFMGSSGFKEEKWLLMMVLSLLFHLAIFSTILFVPKNTVRYPFIEDRIYRVELVGYPSKVMGKGGAQGRAVTKREKTARISKAGTRRITLKKKKAVPVMAKRVSPKHRARPEDNVSPSSGLIDEAISKIEKKVLKEETVQPKEEKTIKAAETQGEPEGEMRAPSPGEVGAHFGMSSEVGKVIALYQMEIETAIKNNWSYPVALINTKKGKMPEAVVILIVRNDGKVLKHSFKRRSHDPLFDTSVLKAIEKSDPLPQFPPGYKKRNEEVEINFSLKDLV
jgi:colicin import membrane protein